MLKVFQLRVARSVLGLGVRDIGAYINLSRTSISKIENKKYDTNISIDSEQNIILVKIFNDQGIFFPDDTSICYGKVAKEYNDSLTRFQLRGGRAILALSQRELSESTGIERKVIHYLECTPNLSYINKVKKFDVDINIKLKEYFNQNTISFPSENIIKISG